MSYNLDDIDFAKAVNPAGKTYAALRKELKPVYKKVWWDVLKGYTFLLLVFSVNAFLIQTGHFNSFIGVPLGALLAGYGLAYLHLFIHAAAHYDIHPDKRKNDLLSDLFIGAFFGISQEKYRKIHWLHHVHLGKTSDSEHSYFNELNILFIIKCITGIHTLSVILSRIKTGGNRPAVKKTSIAYPLYLLLFHALLLFVLFTSGGWPLILIWLSALAIVFPLLATLRQLMEHRDLNALGKIDYRITDHGKVSRLFGEGVIDSSFGAAGFNRHLLHHWDPAVSYTRLPEVENFLLQCPETAIIVKESKSSYLKTFVALFNIR